MKTPHSKPMKEQGTTLCMYWSVRRNETCTSQHDPLHHTRTKTPREKKSNDFEYFIIPTQKKLKLPTCQEKKRNNRR